MSHGYYRLPHFFFGNGDRKVAETRTTCGSQRSEAVANWSTLEHDAAPPDTPEGSAHSSWILLATGLGLEILTQNADDGSQSANLSTRIMTHEQSAAKLSIFRLMKKNIF